MVSWSYTPATSGHNAVRAQHTGSEPLQARSAVDQLMTMFGATKQIAASSIGTLNADGTGTITIVVTAT